MDNSKLSPTKKALLEKWLQGKGKSNPGIEIPKRPYDSPVVLSLSQQRQLFLELLDRGTAVNNLSVFIEFDGKLDIATLEMSANQILERHDTLRTFFSFDQAIPVPNILETFKLSLVVTDIKEIEKGKAEKEARRLAEIEVLRPFDLTQAPLIRLGLYKIDRHKHLFLVVAHHTIADGWSLGVFLKELMIFYKSNLKGQEPAFPPLPIQYADYAHWQTNELKKQRYESSMVFWKEYLSGELPVLQLPVDRPRGNRQTFSGGTHRFVISKTITEKLEELARNEDVTFFMLLLSAYSILLYKYSGQDEVLIGTPVANRNLTELEPLIGIFINTLVLRMKITGDNTFKSFLRYVRSASTKAYAHQDLPFEKLVKELKPKRDLSRTPLFQVVFNLQSTPLPKLEIGDIETSFKEIDRGVSQFDLTLMILKNEGKCHATIEYNKDLFLPETIERMFSSFQMILEKVVNNPNIPIFKIPVVPKEEINRLVVDLNNTEFNYPGSVCMHQLFEKQVQQTPNAVAIIHQKNQLSYQEVNSGANQLAWHLKEIGVGNGSPVGVLLKRSSEMITVLLAIHKAGGSYVPLHNSFPKERIEFVLKDAGISVLIANDHIDPKIKDIDFINLDEDPISYQINLPNLPASSKLQDLAYTIYTSGSTGKPKGVMINHSSLVNFLMSMRLKPGIDNNDILMAVTSISFDIAALEMFLPLTVGAAVVIATEEMLNNPILINEAINYHKVSIMQATPATWLLMIKSGWRGKSDLKALCGGEALSRKLANQLLNRVGTLWNMYGPTETTIWSSISRIYKDDSTISIGHAIGNTQLYILDDFLQAVPIGVVGELYIGGKGLAPGYLKRPQLTKQKFIPNPFNNEPDSRLFKTGDNARYLLNDSIEILGRKDDQHKINGHRIELGEINTTLSSHPSVSESIVICQQEDYGRKNILAYYISPKGVKTNELIEFMKRKLPSYMIPSIFTQLNSIPLSTNGKIDRSALPIPKRKDRQLDYVAPRDECEEILVKIWQNALNIKEVGIHDNFFELGGASIQSLLIVAKANMYGFQINVEHLFEKQTIAELAALIKKELQ